MVKFRWHRGSLAESMATVVDVADRAALISHLRTDPFTPPFTDDEVSLTAHGFDERIGWDTYLVTINGSAVGMTDGPLP